ncbi:MAG: hypothetical protein ACLGIJ_08090 [Candidatus Limnocylindria bacterium]
MDDRHEPGDVTRLGPRGGPGPGPGHGAGPGVRFVSWEWGPGDGRRPGLPWFGVFLLIFGGLLLLEQLVPEARDLGSGLVLAVGLAFLVKWVVDRGTGSLYAGAIITALAMPGVLQAFGVRADGLTTLSLGIAFLALALIRALSGGGLGWQATVGGLLTLLGLVSALTPSIGGLIIPILLVVLGVLLLARGGISRPVR